MKISALKYSVLSWLSGVAMLILLLMPFHAFLTVWGASLFGHYTALRLWKEVLLALSVIGVLYLLITDHKIRSHTLTRHLVWLILGYIALTLVWGLVAYERHEVSAKALGYGLVSDLRYLVFFLVTWAVALRLGRLRAHWRGLILWPAALVVLFGLLQIFILPHNFLTHFGYGPNTIPAMETINHNSHYYRIASTLRGANPLGAYLLIPISLLTVLLLGARRSWRQIVLLVGALVTLMFSFSRSAWIGVALSVAIICALEIKSKPLRLRLLSAAAVLILVLSGLAIGLRNNTHFQNIFLHTQTHSAVATNSDTGHLSALRSGLHDIAHQPLGRGPGTAGPASVYNGSHPARIAENYYVQIGQETGWLGLAAFVLINLGIGYLLWIRRADPLALCLFASLVGLTFINLLSHAWADDTLAYIWWGLAGIAMAPIDQKPENG